MIRLPKSKRRWKLQDFTAEQLRSSYGVPMQAAYRQLLARREALKSQGIGTSEHDRLIRQSERFFRRAGMAAEMGLKSKPSRPAGAGRWRN
jgi:hypothetical protein